MKSFIAAIAFVLLAAAPASAQPAPDHAEWDGLLSRYVVESADGINRVRYAAWKANSADHAALRAYIRALEAVSAADMARNDEFAFWVNLYNAITVDLVLDAYPVASIRDIKPHLLASGPWDVERVTVEGRRLSLNDIEHRILRVRWSEPRVHYAVNCASLGCPNLMPRAWSGATLNADLDAAARAFIGHPRGAAFGARGITLSRIFQWYRGDFGNEAQLRAHLARYSPAARRADLDTRPIVGYAYDWSLNEVRD
jgi:hypothetical protein